MEDMAAAGVVEFNQQDYTVLALPEAHHMTRSMIRLSTMRVIMHLDPACTMHNIVVEVCGCSEMSKPVRRNEKKTLNDMMRGVRYPLKIRVQEPRHKAYVLLLTAVDKIHINDFSLRVEQSELVEQFLRVLSALQDNAIERNKGKLLESSVFLKRALNLQMWESVRDDRSLFELCSGIAPAIVPRFVEAGLASVNDVLKLTARELQRELRCSTGDAQKVIQFGKMLRLSKVTADISLSGREDSTCLAIKVQSLKDKQHHMSAVQRQEVEQNFQSMTFHLICYELGTGKLFLYRKFTSSLQSQVFTVPLGNDGVSDKNATVSLICDSMVGLDYSTSSAENSETSEPLQTTEPNEPFTTPTSFENPSSSEVVSTQSGKKRTTRQSQLEKSYFSSNVASTPSSRKRGRRRSPPAQTTDKASKKSDFGMFEYKPLRDRGDETISDSTNGRFKKASPRRLAALSSGAHRCEAYASSYPAPPTKDPRPVSPEAPVAQQSRYSSAPTGPLHLMRSKAAELNLEQAPIVRLRSRSTSGATGYVDRVSSQPVPSVHHSGPMLSHDTSHPHTPGFFPSHPGSIFESMCYAYPSPYSYPPPSALPGQPVYDTLYSQYPPQSYYPAPMQQCQSFSHAATAPCVGQLDCGISPHASSSLSCAPVATPASSRITCSHPQFQNSAIPVDHQPSSLKYISGNVPNTPLKAAAVHDMESQPQYDSVDKEEIVVDLFEKGFL